jgi:hypothetical protein
MRNAVRFKSAKFNTTQIRDYFINDICFDDLANWLSEELSGAGLKTARPWQEDWGWQFEAENCLISVGYNVDEWQIYIEPIVGFFEKLAGKQVDISKTVKNLHRILEKESEIFDIEWFVSEKSGKETDFANEP